MSNIYVKKAQLHDLSRIMEIIDSAKALLKADGSSQWQDGTPNQATLTSDINNGDCWILKVGDQIAGTATLLTTPDPNYAEILDGQWKNTSDSYATIHRIAIDSNYRGMALSKFFLSNLISLGNRVGFTNFRIDTHELNQRMQHLVQQFDFEYTGIIYVNPGEDGRRLAFELNLEK
jgi:ribosomal protein S18 acetylase RimI-like enzyme